MQRYSICRFRDARKLPTKPQFWPADACDTFQIFSAWISVLHAYFLLYFCLLLRVFFFKKRNVPLAMWNQQAIAKHLFWIWGTHLPCRKSWLLTTVNAFHHVLSLKHYLSAQIKNWGSEFGVAVDICKQERWLGSDFTMLLNGKVIILWDQACHIWHFMNSFSLYFDTACSQYTLHDTCENFLTLDQLEINTV